MTSTTATTALATGTLLALGLGLAAPAAHADIDVYGPHLQLGADPVADGWYAQGDLIGLEGSAVDASGIGVVELAVKRTNGKGCRHLQADGSIGFRTNCRWQRLTVSWVDGPWHMATDFIPGSYKLRVDAEDALGNASALTLRFRVG